MVYMNTQSTFIKKFDNWKKYGLIVYPKFKKKWMNSHTAVPFVEKISDNKFKIYFCIRDKKNRSHIVSERLDLKKKINYITSKIELYHGKLGEFDESGVTPTWIINVNKKKYLYYVGWRPGGSVRLSLFTGLAIKKSKTNIFKKIRNTPILERSKIDPFLTATLSIIREKNKYKMWYVSGEGWIKLKNNETIPRYNIKYAVSKNGLDWKRLGITCIDFKSKFEHAIARPSVIKFKGIYYMWYCYKKIKEHYKIGFAVSKDGIKWKRYDQYCSTLNNSRKNWEKQMLAYPHVIQNDNELLMFYNGNEYGKSGIGLAKLDLKNL